MLAGFVASVAPLGTVAADVRYGVTIGGRPLDSAGHSGLLHDGVTFVNVVRGVRAFSGLLVFLPSGVLRIAVGKHSFVFTLGSRTATYDRATTVRLGGAPFELGGETYVPVSAFALLTGSTVTVDPKRRSIDFDPGGGSADPQPTPTPARSPSSN